MTILETLLEEFYARLSGFARINPRETQLPKLKGKIKAVIGMRRTGKTYFLYQQIYSLLKSGLDKQRILYINFEDDRISPMSKREFAQLLDNFYSLYPDNHHQLCYLFLDEIQNVDEWEQVIRRFFDSKPVEIILSGSSAKLLSKEIPTSLRGRSYTTEIWPYSFSEYLKLQQLLPKKDQPIGKITLDKLLSQLTVYLKNGGFPELLAANEEERFHTLQDYVKIVTYRDIIERHKITNVRLVKHMIKHLTQNTATNFSVNKFYNDLKSQGFKVSRGTIYDYLSYIEDAYLNFSVTLYDGSLRKSQVNPRKIYSIDPGLSRVYMLNYSDNYGRLFETMVYIELRRRHYQIYYYLTKQRYEVDFIVETPQSERMLYQVVWNISDDKTLEREMRALKEAEQELGVKGVLVTPESFLRLFVLPK